MFYAVLSGQCYMQVQDINNLYSLEWPTLHASSRYQRYMQSWVANVACKFKISTFYAVLGACKFKISTFYTVLGACKFKISMFHAVLGGQRCMQVQDINVLCSPKWPTLYISTFYAVLGGQRCIYQRYMEFWMVNVACKSKISTLYAVLGGQRCMQV